MIIISAAVSATLIISMVLTVAIKFCCKKRSKSANFDEERQNDEQEPLLSGDRIGQQYSQNSKAKGINLI